jgi:diguanylate cyclase (GGDEF)-like protein
MNKNRSTETVIVSLQQEPVQTESAEENCLVVLYGENIGRRHFLTVDGDHIIGRADSASIHIDQDSVSRQHARMYHKEGNWHIEDMQSTNGTFVNNVRVRESLLRDGDLLRLGQTIFKMLSGSNIESKYHEEIYRLSTVDGLTETYNKRYFMEALQREISRAHRYQRQMCLCLFDIDHFKRVNDTYGHLAGDFILRELAHLIGQNIRRQDILARYGGEEFAIIFPEADATHVIPVCEKLRLKVEEHAFIYNQERIPVTISLGLNCFEHSQGFVSGEAFIGLADARLYKSKQAGRNRLSAN